MSDFGIQNIGFIGGAFATASTLLMLAVLLPVLRDRQNAKTG